MCCFVADLRRSRSRSPSRRHSRSRSPSNRRDDAAHSSPLGTGEMLTREEFERFQHAYRMTSGLVWTDPSPHAQFPQHIPVQHPPHLVYPASGAPASENLPPQHHVMFTHQPMMMPPPLHEQPRPFLGPAMEPARLMPPPAPSHEAYHDPQLVVPPGVPIPSPAVFHPAPPPGAGFVLTGDLHMPVAQHLPPPAAFQHVQVVPPGPQFVLPSENPHLAAQMHPPNSFQFQQQ